MFPEVLERVLKQAQRNAEKDTLPIREALAINADPAMLQILLRLLVKGLAWSRTENGGSKCIIPTS
jgi:hypothetical protein